MAWPLILAITFLVINIALFASTFYQILLLSDLEADYINMYEAASRINGLILPDFILQGVLSVLLLMTGHWFMFLVSVPVTCYHVMLYIKQRHLIDVTEVFRVLAAEKKYRMVKLGLLSVLFLMVIFRFIRAGHLLFRGPQFGDLDIRSSFLEF
ncbi:protein cornichon homolog 1 isoform X1 [Rhodamnia argentea]|uniref:Protein cornichon homolog 1 isoform X1 n=1 Tax=Rhodamnia argentea TaxID=178133 RepID=A0A8B8NBF9_9MYRT|nr:protein cornichon homolog 1 isoform X1 [Rhodamnia argentea]